MRATQAIGDGFYGVDVKEVAGNGYIIEADYLGEELYQTVMGKFLRRLEKRSQGH